MALVTIEKYCKLTKMVTPAGAMLIMNSVNNYSNGYRNNRIRKTDGFGFDNCLAPPIPPTNPDDIYKQYSMEGEKSTG